MRRGGLLLALALASCGGGTEKPGAVRTVSVTITGPSGRHVFVVELAGTEAAQAQGLMFRTDLSRDGGMLFWPYPPGGGPPRPANFWMKTSPTPLDLVFIRADGTIARVAENAIPMSETLIPSGEPVAAVLELVGGRAAETGISEGDKVIWPR